MALTLKQPGAYIGNYVFRLGDHVDVSRFKAAWDTTTSLCNNLRTRIMFVGEAPVQVILRGDILWEHVETTLETFLSHKPLMGYGTPLSNYSMVTDKGVHYFVWAGHHAVYDGWSMRVVLETLDSAYHGTDIKPILPYSGFIKYTMDLDMDASRTFWTEQLKGATKATFPPRNGSVPKDSLKREAGTFDHTINFPQHDRTSITKATVIRAAWGLVLARYCNTDDVFFGLTVSGRQAPVPGLESMPGPMIATVPARTRLGKEQSVTGYLVAVQSQATETIPFEQLGLHNIAKLSSDARTACDFTSLLVIQPPIKTTDSNSNAVLVVGDAEQDYIIASLKDDYFNYPLVIIASLSNASADIRFFYDPSILSEAQILAVSQHFDHVVQQLFAQDKPLCDVLLVGQWDIEHAIESSCLQPATDSCTHWLIEAQIKARPSEPAVTSWDGDLTYAELGKYASGLAHKLQQFGVGPETLVPLCFPKSTWAIIAMVATQMAGGAFVAIDPNAPVARLRGIVDDTKATLVLAAPSCQGTAEQLGTEVVLISEEFLMGLPNTVAPVKSATQPSNASFIVFTSGSTGKPKGIVLQHDATCSSVYAYGRNLNIGPRTRVFQFSTYTFDVGILDVLATLMLGGCISFHLMMLA